MGLKWLGITLAEIPTTVFLLQINRKEANANVTEIQMFYFATKNISLDLYSAWLKA